MDEENTSARRGRPRGTGIDDVPTLAAVADVLLASPGMRPSTAMKRVVRGLEATQLRRLQEKWKVQGGRFLAEAGERAQTAAALAASEAVVRAERGAGSGNAKEMAWMAAMLAGIDAPGMRTNLDIANSPAAIEAMKAMRDMADSPATKWIREIVEPPFMQYLRGSENSMIMKLVRDAERLNRLCDPLGQRRK